MAIDWSVAFHALMWMLLLAGAVWAVSLPLQNASIVDSFWSLFFVVGAAAYSIGINAHGERVLLVAILLGAWAARLSLYITWRNLGHGEDRRYQAIRARNQPHYAIKSLFYVFGFQGVLAWIVAMPLLAQLGSATPLGWLDMAGMLVWGIGFLFETIADWQLSQFKANPAHLGQIMDKGLWRYTRHPNYFGEAMVWWGFWLLAASAGHAWTVFAPLIMTLMLLKVSGVSLLEKDMQVRHPAYVDYMRRTNAFLPGPPRRIAAKGETV